MNTIRQNDSWDYPNAENVTNKSASPDHMLTGLQIVGKILILTVTMPGKKLTLTNTKIHNANAYY